jgi:Leucine-rich repeat (LRR) protein
MIMSRRKSGSTGGGSSRLVRNPNFFQASPSSQSYARGIPQAVLSQARKTGQLNLSDKGIRDIPASLWTLNVDVPEGASLSFEGEERWWDQALLTRLNLSSNEIHQISPKIENFTSLDTLELQYNQITELPVTIGTLVNLQKLFISYNQLVSLPGEVSSLVNLRILHLNNNKLTCLPMSITQLEHLEDLNVASNELGVLPDGMACLVHLRALNLSQNKLTGLPADIGNMKGSFDLILCIANSKRAICNQ